MLMHQFIWVIKEYQPATESANKSFWCCNIITIGWLLLVKLQLVWTKTFLEGSTWSKMIAESSQGWSVAIPTQTIGFSMVFVHFLFAWSHADILEHHGKQMRLCRGLRAMQKMWYDSMKYASKPIADGHTPQGQNVYSTTTRPWLGILILEKS